MHLFTKIYFKALSCLRLFYFTEPEHDCIISNYITSKLYFQKSVDPAAALGAEISVKSLFTNRAHFKFLQMFTIIGIVSALGKTHLNGKV